MRFDYPWLLLLLLLLIPGWWLWQRSVRKRKERMRRFAESAFTEKIFVGNNPRLRRWHFILFFSGCILLILAATAPKIPGGKENVKISGIDVMIVLDVSNSMRANDLQPSRLDRAKLALQNVMSQMSGDRFGIVVFAGHPFVSLPISDDPNAAQMMLSSISTQNVSVQGTAIGEAISLASESFPPLEKNENRGRAIILISDGENHEDNAAKAAGEAAANGIIVCSIGIGTPEGGKIPELDEKGVFKSYKRDRDGNEIVTRLDETGLKEIAKEGQGIYVRSTASDIGVGTVYSKLQSLSKTSRDTWQYKDFTQLFPLLAGIAILLLLIEPLLPEGNRNENKTHP